MGDYYNYPQSNQGQYAAPNVQEESNKKIWLWILIPFLLIVIGVVIFLLIYSPTKSISEEEFSQGTSLSLKEDKEVKFFINEKEHTMKVDSVSDDSVSLTIQSNPIKINIKIGEEKKFDLDDDGFYDIKIKLKDIEDGIPEIYIKKIHESSCIEDWDCGSWNNCSEQGEQIRNCTDLNSCGTSENKPITIHDCTYVENCFEDWNCTNWSLCTDGQKIRNCTDLNSCGTTENKSSEEEDCEEGLEDFDEEWEVYLEFLSAIDNKDLDKLNSIGYANYSECFDYFNETECWELMGGMNELVGVIPSKENVTTVWKDNKQTILQANTLEGSVQVLLVKDSAGEIKISKIENPASNENSADSDKDGRSDNDEDCSAIKYASLPDQCIETDIDDRDSDNDGWWDGIEVAAETDPNDSGDILFG